jgi:hypothetical protein
MVTRELIEKLIGKRVNEVLLIAEASLPQTQFQAFRKLTLNQFGQNGLGKDLDEVFGEDRYQERQGMGRQRLCKKRSEP